MHGLIHDITLCIAAAWLLGLVAQFLRQPVLLAYLVGGFALGPAGLGYIEEAESIHAISELGLIFLLFMIGLEFSLARLKEISSSESVSTSDKVFERLVDVSEGDMRKSITLLQSAQRLVSRNETLKPEHVAEVAGVSSGLLCCKQSWLCVDRWSLTMSSLGCSGPAKPTRLHPSR